MIIVNCDLSRAFLHKNRQNQLIFVQVIPIYLFYLFNQVKLNRASLGARKKLLKRWFMFSIKKCLMYKLI